MLAIFIRTFFIQAYKIPSGSMEPTLLIGDHILVNKMIYGVRMPDSILGLEIPGLPYGQYLVHFEAIHRSDVVVFVFPPDRTKDFIKRVIGLPGDTIQVKNGHVWLNGQAMDDPHGHFEVADRERSPISPRSRSYSCARNASSSCRMNPASTIALYSSFSASASATTISASLL